MTPDQFRAARLSLGLTQIQLATEWGMTNNGARTIRRWENGERVEYIARQWNWGNR